MKKKKRIKRIRKVIAEIIIILRNQGIIDQVEKEDLLSQITKE